MKVRYLGEIVRRKRKQLGLRQDQVCGGLCSAMTLSRFESGKQTPSRDCVVAILQRLGLPDNQCYAQLTREESQLFLLRKKVNAYYRQFELMLGEARQQARMNALDKLRELESCIKEDDCINQQFVLRMNASLGEYSPEIQLEMLIDALRITSPRFDLDELSSCLYCTDELILIHKIARRHFRCGQRKKAIDIYEQLLNLVLKRTPDHDNLPLIAYNYARYLAIENRLEEALEISKLGRQICIKQGNYYAFPGFLHIGAGCYYHMGDLSRSEELYRSAYYIYGAIMNTRDQEFLKAVARERFNLVF